MQWDGVTKASTLRDDLAEAWKAIHAAAKAGEWTTLLELIDDDPQLANVVGLDEEAAALLTPLHYMAELGASKELCAKLLKAGAWRSARSAAGETPEEVAKRAGRGELEELLKPSRRADAPEPSVLKDIQKHFHDVILGRCKNLVEEHGLRLPELEPLVEEREGEEEGGSSWYFAVPGMYGGFSYRMADVGGDSVLVAESWCRVVGGSGQRHIVTPFGSVLSAEGFV